MTIEIPDTPAELQPWLEKHGYVINECAGPVFATKGDVAVTHNNVVVALTHNDADAIAFVLGRFALAKLAGRPT